MRWFFIVPCCIGYGVGRLRDPRNVSVQALRDVSSISCPYFPLDFVLGKGPGCIEYQGMLVKGKLVMLGFSVSQLFTLTMGGGRDYYEWARIVGGN